MKLGLGASGPWENRTAFYHANANGPFSRRVVAAHLNNTYSVQRAQHPEHPGVDHLVIRRHDQADVAAPWDELQALKDRLAPDGQLRFAIEIFPPRRLVVDNYPLRHLWVMPLGWEPGFGIHGEQPGAVPV